MMTSLVTTIEHSLPDDFCEQLISKFEKDDRKHIGEIGSRNTNQLIKRSTDLHISSYPEWKDEDNRLHQYLNDALHQYVSLVSDYHHSALTNNISDTGYQIQRTNPNEYYAWHHDQSDLQCRMLTYMWYLNTVKHGGYTEFHDGKKVYPERGKLLLFPATWEYVHRGFPPCYQSKYVCIGWTLYTGANGIN